MTFPQQPDARQGPSACANDSSVAVVVPVYRNMETLFELHHRLSQVLENLRVSAEIIFVDDACPAGSLGCLQALVDKDPRVQVLALGHNVGQHQAILVGLAHVQAQMVVVMDADLQDPPEAIPIVLAKLQEGYGAVFAGRRGRYESAWRLFTSRMFKQFLHLLNRVPADAGMFVALDRQMVDRLLAFRMDRPYLVAMIGWSGLPLASVPVERHRRPCGRSAYDPWRRLKVAGQALGSSLACRWGLAQSERQDGTAEIPMKVYGRSPVAAGRSDTARQEGATMSRMPEGLREQHNLDQRRYYERQLKPRMLPRESQYIRRQVDELLRFGGIRPGDRVLELGCGMGRYTLRLAELGIKVEGLDISPVMLEELRKLEGGRYHIPLHCADIVRFPKDLTGQFDAVLGFFTLHHLHDLSLCFESMTKVLKPGGTVVFLEPNPYNALFYIQILVAPGMTWQGDRGLVLMRRHVIFQAMAGARLRHPSMTRFGFFPPFLTNRLWGAKLEGVLERIPLWRPLLPFQLFRAEWPGA